MLYTSIVFTRYFQCRFLLCLHGLAIIPTYLASFLDAFQPSVRGIQGAGVDIFWGDCIYTGVSFVVISHQSCVD